MQLQRYRKIPYILLLFAMLLSACASTARSSGSTAIGQVSSVSMTDTVETSGNLSADQLVTLSWGTSGLVDRVNVKEGDLVKKGDVLAVLKTDSVPAEVLSSLADLASTQRDLQDMQDSETALALAQQKVLDSRKDVEEAQNMLDALDYPRASDTLIENTKAKILLAEKTLTLATRRYKEVQQHPDGDPQKTQALLDMTNAQLNLNELNATLNWYLAEPTQDDYDEAIIALDVARATYNDAKRNRDKVKEGYDQIDFAAAQAKVAAAQGKVEVMTIIAPFDGEVIMVKTSPNSTVSSGDKAIGLVNRSTMKIDVQIDETSIAEVKVGDVAQITMDSLPDTTLTGKVSLIDPIGNTVGGLVKYTVTILLDPTDANVLFGSTASVVLLTSEPRSMLAVPINAVQTGLTSEYVVVLISDGSMQNVNIETGDLSGNLVTLIQAGSLKEGDQVIMGSASSDTTSGSSNRNSDQGGPGGGFPGGGFIPGGG